MRGGAVRDVGFILTDDESIPCGTQLKHTQKALNNLGSVVTPWELQNNTNCSIRALFYHS